MPDFVEHTEQLEVLRGLNPWWRRRPISVPRFHRVAYFRCQYDLADSSHKRAVLVSGPRRVGKTTMLLQIAQSQVGGERDPKSVFYISLDHPILKLLTLPKILTLYHEMVFPEGQPVLLLLDEVQYTADWADYLKQLIDHSPNYRIVATGSASILLRSPLADSGVGRWTTVPMPTLSFFEFMQIRNADLPAIPDGLRPKRLFELSAGELGDIGQAFRASMPLFRHYLLVGGFPETAKMDDVGNCQRLLREDVVERVLKRDVASLFRVRNVDQLERLFVYLCLNTGGILGVRECAVALQATPTTVSNWLEMLEQANLIYRLPPAGIGGKKALKRRYKVYLVDAALRNAVLLRGEGILNNPTEAGLVVETTVHRHLRAFHYPDTPQIMYWRDTKTHKEVDIIVKSPSYVVPVEIKYRSDARLRLDEGIVSFSRGEDVAQAYWITQREQDFGVDRFPGLETRFLSIPAHIFTYLIGQAERLLWPG